EVLTITPHLWGVVERERRARGDAQRQTCASGNPDRYVEAFFGRDATQKSQVSTRLWIERELIEIDAVIDRPPPIGGGQRTAKSFDGASMCQRAWSTIGTSRAEVRESPAANKVTS